MQLFSFTFVIKILHFISDSESYLIALRTGFVQIFRNFSHAR